MFISNIFASAPVIIVNKVPRRTLDCYHTSSIQTFRPRLSSLKRVFGTSNFCCVFSINGIQLETTIQFLGEDFRRLFCSLEWLRSFPIQKPRRTFCIRYIDIWISIEFTSYSCKYGEINATECLFNFDVVLVPLIYVFDLALSRLWFFQGFSTRAMGGTRSHMWTLSSTVSARWLSVGWPP